MSQYSYRAPVRRSAPVRRESMAKAKPANRSMAFFLCVVLVIALFVYISRMATIASGAKEISMLRQEVANLNSDKQYREITLASRQNLERVQYEALNRLGMVYPQDGQVQVIYLGDYTVDPGTRTAYDTGAKDGE